MARRPAEVMWLARPSDPSSCAAVAAPAPPIRPRSPPASMLSRPSQSISVRLLSRESSDPSASTISKPPWRNAMLRAPLACNRYATIAESGSAVPRNTHTRAHTTLYLVDRRVVHKRYRTAPTSARRLSPCVKKTRETSLNGVTPIRNYRIGCF